MIDDRQPILDQVRAYAAKKLAANEFVPGVSSVPVSGKVLDPEDFPALVDASLEGWLTVGRFHPLFERNLAKYVGARSAIFVNSGSSAKARIDNFAYLSAKPQGVMGVFLLVATPMSLPSWVGFPLTLDPEHLVDRAELMRLFDERGIRELFADNLTKQPSYPNTVFRVLGDLTNTDFATNRTFWVGTDPGLTTPMLDYMADSLHEFMADASR